MKKILRPSLDVLLYVFSFLTLQVLCSLPIALVTHGNQVATIIWGSALSGVLTIFFFFLFRWTPVDTTFMTHKPWKTLTLVAALALALILPSTWLLEVSGVEMDKELEEVFTLIMSQPWGIIPVVIMAPLAEEVVFRGAVLGRLLPVMKSKWVAIGISAVLFGCIHGNLAQGINATILGILLGWLYTETRSLLPGMILHFVNNLMAYVLTFATGDVDAKLIDIFGGSSMLMLTSVAVSALIAGALLCLLCKKLSSTPRE